MMRNAQTPRGKGGVSFAINISIIWLINQATWGICDVLLAASHPRELWFSAGKRRWQAPFLPHIIHGDSEPIPQKAALSALLTAYGPGAISTFWSGGSQGYRRLVHY